MGNQQFCFFHKMVSIYLFFFKIHLVTVLLVSLLSCPLYCSSVPKRPHPLQATLCSLFILRADGGSRAQTFILILDAVCAAGTCSMMHGVRGFEMPDSLRLLAGNNTYFFLSSHSCLFPSCLVSTLLLTLIASPPPPQRASSCCPGAVTLKATSQSSM